MKQTNYSAIIFIIITLVAIIGGGLLLVLSGGSSTPGVSAEVVDGKQLASIAIQDRGYFPATITVKAGMPVELTFTGKSYGCASAIISRDFWSGIKMVDFGKSETIKFTPDKTGKFKYSCSMGMYVGYINVV